MASTAWLAACRHTCPTFLPMRSAGFRLLERAAATACMRPRSHFSVPIAPSQEMRLAAADAGCGLSPPLRGQPGHDRARRRCPARKRRQFSNWKRIGTSTVPSSGLPPSAAGSKRHWRTAAAAASVEPREAAALQHDDGERHSLGGDIHAQCHLALLAATPSRFGVAGSRLAADPRAGRAGVSLAGNGTDAAAGPDMGWCGGEPQPGRAWTWRGWHQCRDRFRRRGRRRRHGEGASSAGGVGTAAGGATGRPRAVGVRDRRCRGRPIEHHDDRCIHRVNPRSHRRIRHEQQPQRYQSVDQHGCRERQRHGPDVA